MLNTKKANYERPSTVIGKETTIEMSLMRSSSSVQINGKLTGDIDVEASLVIGQGGKVIGNIKSVFLLVAGTVEGNIVAKEQIHLTKSAEILGDITCGSMIIDDGAVINGRCKTENHHAPEKKAPQSNTAVAK